MKNTFFSNLLMVEAVYFSSKYVSYFKLFIKTLYKKYLKTSYV